MWIVGSGCFDSHVHAYVNTLSTAAWFKEPQKALELKERNWLRIYGALIFITSTSTPVGFNQTCLRHGYCQEVLDFSWMFSSACSLPPFVFPNNEALSIMGGMIKRWKLYRTKSVKLAANKCPRVRNPLLPSNLDRIHFQTFCHCRLIGEGERLLPPWLPVDLNSRSPSASTLHKRNLSLLESGNMKIWNWINSTGYKWPSFSAPGPGASVSSIFWVKPFIWFSAPGVIRNWTSPVWK